MLCPNPEGYASWSPTCLPLVHLIKIVVFRVGGVINITSRIVVSSRVTIAGQTAPGQGITVYGNGVSYSSADNTITRYIRYRMGKNGM